MFMVNLQEIMFLYLQRLMSCLMIVILVVTSIAPAYASSVEAFSPTINGGRPVYAPGLDDDEVVEDGFPEDLHLLTYEHVIAGGSGGVVVLKDVLSQKFYSLKAAKHIDHIKEEIIADALYRAFGVPVPAFMVVDQLPEGLRIQLPFENTKGPYRIAHFILKDREQPYEEMLEQLSRFEVIDWFLRNYDVKGAQFENIIRDTHGVLWRIDNGGALRYRAKGEVKEDGAESHSGRDIITRFAKGDLRVVELVTRFPKALQTLRTIGTALQLPLLEELDHALVCRYRDILTHYSGVYSSPFSSRYEWAVPGKTSASAFLYSYQDGQPFVLLGKRQGTGLWGNLGGGSDLNDRLLSRTAAREVLEESLGLITLSAQDLAAQPYHDLLTENAAYGFLRHRMYFHQLDQAVSAASLNRALQDALENEYTQYKWVNLKVLIASLLSDKRVKQSESRASSRPRNTVVFMDNEEEMFVHPPLYRMLMQPQVFSQLMNIYFDQPLCQHHYQGWEREANVSHYLYKSWGPEIKWASANLVNIDGQTYPQDVVSLEELSFELARNTIKRAGVLSELKKKQAKPVHEVAPLLPYTQTQAYLRNLDKDYDPKLSLVENARGFQVRKLRADEDRDATFLSVIDQILLNEQLHRQGHFVIYSGTNSEISAAEDIFTMARDLLETFSDVGQRVLRGRDEAFKTPAQVMAFLALQNTIAEEQRSLGQSVQLDYSPGYQDQALSGSASLFGSHEMNQESAYHYFKRRQSIVPPDFELIVRKFFKQFGIEVDAKRYLKLYEDYYEAQSHGDPKARRNTAMYQLFFREDVLDQLTYNSGTGGGNFDYLIANDTHPRHSLVQLMTRPEEQPKGDVHNHQVKVLLHPSIVLDPTKVNIYKYWQYPLSQEQTQGYMTALKRLVHEDLTRALHAKVAHRKNTFQSGRALMEGTLSPTEYVYQMAHADILQAPINYRPAEVTLNELSAHLSMGDYDEFYQQYLNLAEKGPESLNVLFAAMLEKVLQDQTQLDKAVGVFKFLMSQGREFSNDDVKRIVSLIGPRSEALSYLAPEKGMQLLKHLITPTNRITVSVLHDVVQNVASPLKLLEFLLQYPTHLGEPYDERELMKRMQDAASKFILKSSTRVEESYEDSRLIKQIYEKIYFSPQDEKLRMIALLSPIMWPVDDTLHRFFNARDWGALREFAQTRVGEILMMAVYRLQDPSLEHIAKIIRSCSPSEPDPTRDNKVDYASYDFVRTLLKMQPAAQVMDRAMAMALYHMKTAALQILLAHRPDHIPQTESQVDKLLDSHQGKFMLEDAIKFHENDIVDLFLSRMKTVDSSYLIWAIRARNYVALQAMLNKVSDPEVPLSVAIAEHDSQAVGIILEAKDFKPSYLYGTAVRTGNQEIIRHMEASANPQDFGQMLMAACEAGDSALVDRFMERADPRYLSSALRDVLWTKDYAASLQPHILRIRENVFQRMCKYVDSGVQLDVKEAIMGCIQVGDLDFLHRLNSTFKPDLNVFELGVTPVMMAIYYDEPEILEYLLQNGANPNLVNAFTYDSPLLIAIKRQFHTDVANRTIYKFFRHLQQRYGDDYTYSRHDESDFHAFMRCGRSYGKGSQAHAVLEDINFRMVQILVKYGADKNPQLRLAYPENHMSTHFDRLDDGTRAWVKRYSTSEELDEQYRGMQFTKSPLKEARHWKLHQIVEFLQG